MKKKTKFIYTIGILLFFALVIVFLNVNNPSIPWEFHKYPYEEQLSFEENLENKISDYLEKETKWYRLNRSIKNYEIISVKYDSLDFYEVDLNLSFRKNHSEHNPFKRGETKYYFRAEKFPQEVYVYEVLSREEYQKTNEIYDTSDVTINTKDVDRKQTKLINDILYISNNYGTSWVNTQIKTELDDVADIYIEENQMGVLVRVDSQLMYYVSDDFGETWQSNRFQMLFKGYSGHFNQGILLIDDEKSVFIVSLDAAMGSVYNILIHTYDNGETYQYISDLDSSKPYKSSSVISNEDVYFEDESGRVYESHDSGYTFNYMEVPYHDEEVWGFDFNEIFVDLEVPRFIDGKLTLYANQGSLGDVKANAKAEFISMDGGKTWKFERYLLLKDEIVD